MHEVAVVVPVKNRREMVVRAIASVLGQTAPPSEIVVVDDGSTDGTADAVRALGDPRVAVIPSRSAGPAGARNTGIDATAAPHIAFLDSDDTWEPGKLAAQLDLLDRAPAAGLVFSDAWIVPASFRGPTVFTRQPPACGDIEFRLLLDNFIPTSTVIVRRDALGDLRFRPEFSPAEDYDLWQRLIVGTKATFVPKALAVYRLHRGQLGADLPAMYRATRRVVAEASRAASLSPAQKRAVDRRMYRLSMAARRAAARRAWTPAY
ncbi:glycosyltransferase [bacterium]|nr:glycosyltransferase [bacterium]